jgi:hypothetical protein
MGGMDMSRNARNLILQRERPGNEKNARHVPGGVRSRAVSGRRTLEAWRVTRPVAREPGPGRAVAGYRLDEQIGRGGMAVV